MAPLPPDGLTVVAALVAAPGVFVETPDPATPSDVVALVELDDALLFDVEVLELIPGDERDNDGVVRVNRSAMPLLPSTDPVSTLTIGLHGLDVVLVGAGGGGLGGTSEGGFGAPCATAVDPHMMPIQMNSGSFISNLLYGSAVRFTEILVQAASQTAACPL